MASSNESIAHSDVVFVDAIELSANIGADWWGRVRAQPVRVSVYLHLQPGYLDRAGLSDNVLDSIHYGHLSKVISTLVESTGASFAGPHGLARAVAKSVFRFAGSVVSQTRVVVASSKLIPLASEFVLELTTPYSPEEATRDLEKIQVSVNDLTLSTIIGVNPPEREAKQRVITNITICENSGATTPVDYPHLITTIAKNIEESAYLTLEKFVYEIVRTVCLSSEAVESATVRSEKPSALSFARVAGVQITRSRAAFLKE